MSNLETHDAFWECECKAGYIHSKRDALGCKACGARLLDANGNDNGDFPDARVDEMADPKNWCPKCIKFAPRLQKLGVSHAL